LLRVFSVILSDSDYVIVSEKNRLNIVWTGILIYSTDFTCFIRLIVSLEYLSVIFSYSRRIDNLTRSEEEKQ